MKTLITICAIMVASIMGYNQYKTNPRVQQYVHKIIQSTFAHSVQNAYKDKKNKVQVKGRGQVLDPPAQYQVDNQFQIFNVRLKDNHVITVYHDLAHAKFIPNLKEGDDVRFYGEYYYTDAGGEIRFTHKDPKQQRPDGWIEHDHIKYQ